MLVSKAPMLWIAVSDGQVPQGAQRLAVDEDGAPIHLARARKGKEMHFGSVSEGDGCAKLYEVVAGGSTLKLRATDARKYEVLTLAERVTKSTSVLTA